MFNLYYRLLKLGTSGYTVKTILNQLSSVWNLEKKQYCAVILTATHIK